MGIFSPSIYKYHSIILRSLLLHMVLFFRIISLEYNLTIFHLTNYEFIYLFISYNILISDAIIGPSLVYFLFMTDPRIPCTLL